MNDLHRLQADCDHPLEKQKRVGGITDRLDRIAVGIIGDPTRFVGFHEPKWQSSDQPRMSCGSYLHPITPVPTVIASLFPIAACVRAWRQEPQTTNIAPNVAAQTLGWPAYSAQAELDGQD